MVRCSYYYHHLLLNLYFLVFPPQVRRSTCHSTGAPNSPVTKTEKLLHITERQRQLQAFKQKKHSLVGGCIFDTGGGTGPGGVAHHRHHHSDSHNNSSNLASSSSTSDELTLKTSGFGMADSGITQAGRQPVFV